MTDSYRLSSDLHMCAMHTCEYTHTHYIFKNLKINQKAGLQVSSKQMNADETALDDQSLFDPQDAQGRRESAPGSCSWHVHTHHTHISVIKANEGLYYGLIIVD